MTAASDSGGCAPRVGRTVARVDAVVGGPPGSRRAAADVVVVLLDDVGYAQLGCYGSSIATPAMDALACSRAALLELPRPRAVLADPGESAHRAQPPLRQGMGFLGAFDTGFPGYRAAITPAAATLGEMLGPRGYGTYAVGKWHLDAPQPG